MQPKPGVNLLAFKIVKLQFVLSGTDVPHLLLSHGIHELFVPASARQSFSVDDLNFVGVKEVLLLIAVTWRPRLVWNNIAIKRFPEKAEPDLSFHQLQFAAVFRLLNDCIPRQSLLILIKYPVAYSSECS